MVKNYTFLKRNQKYQYHFFLILSVAGHLIRKHVVTAWIWNQCTWKGQAYSHVTHIQRAEGIFSIPSWNYKRFSSPFLTTFCGNMEGETSGYVSLTKRAIDNQNQQLRAKQAAVWLFLKLFENMIIRVFVCLFVFINTALLFSVLTIT